MNFLHGFLSMLQRKLYAPHHPDYHLILKRPFMFIVPFVPIFVSLGTGIVEKNKDRAQKK